MHQGGGGGAERRVARPFFVAQTSPFSLVLPVEQQGVNLVVVLQGAAEKGYPGVVQGFALHADHGRSVVVVLD